MHPEVQQGELRSERFSWRRWGANGVVFDRRYGNTHSLSGLHAQLFDAWLRSGLVALDRLKQTLPSDTSSEAQDDAALAKAVQDLQQLGLIPPH